MSLPATISQTKLVINLAKHLMKFKLMKVKRKIV